MSVLKMHIMELDELHKHMKEYQGNTEDAINEVLHGKAGTLISDEVRRLMPVSGKHWRGKKAAAKSSSSLMNVNENLAVTVKTKKAYQYLYFPDDGTNTRRHVGNQQFFKRGGEAKTDEIINLCIGKLVDDFDR